MNDSIRITVPLTSNLKRVEKLSSVRKRKFLKNLLKKSLALYDESAVDEQLYTYALRFIAKLEGALIGDIKHFIRFLELTNVDITPFSFETIWASVIKAELDVLNGEEAEEWE